jgi:hypothetical protein
VFIFEVAGEILGKIVGNFLDALLGATDHFGLAHFAVDLPILAAVAFIDEHKDIGVIVFDPLVGDGLELVDPRCDDVRFGGMDQLDQAPA